MADKENQKKFWTGVGRRKTAVASVRITEGGADFTINGSKAEISTDVVFTPLELVGKLGAFSISVKVSGGGKISQIESIRLGIARALEKFDPEYRSTLKKASLLTRDPREKERKKPGLRGARRAPQWAKR